MATALTTRQLRTRRYYLHRRARRVGRVVVKPRTIYLSYTDAEITDKYVLELRDRFHYAVQLELLSLILLARLPEQVQQGQQVDANNPEPIRPSSNSFSHNPKL